jgi:hypothetical protein
VEAAGEGTVEFSLDDGPVLAVLTLSPGTAGPYDYATVSAPVDVAAGVHDVRLALRGPVRLARVAFSVRGPRRPRARKSPNGSPAPEGFGAGLGFVRPAFDRVFVAQTVRAQGPPALQRTP